MLNISHLHALIHSFVRSTISSFSQSFIHSCPYLAIPFTPPPPFPVSSCNITINHEISSSYLTSPKGAFIPVLLELLARHNGVLFAHRTTPCISASTTSTSTSTLPYSNSNPPHHYLFISTIPLVPSQRRSTTSSRAMRRQVPGPRHVDEQFCHVHVCGERAGAERCARRTKRVCGLRYVLFFVSVLLGLVRIWSLRFQVFF